MFSCFCVDKFYDEKFNSCQNKKMCFEFLKKNIQKNSFLFCFCLEIGWYFVLNKKVKNENVSKVLNNGDFERIGDHC